MQKSIVNEFGENNMVSPPFLVEDEDIFHEENLKDRLFQNTMIIDDDLIAYHKKNMSFLKNASCILNECS